MVFWFSDYNALKLWGGGGPERGEIFKMEKSNFMEGGTHWLKRGVHTYNGFKLDTLLVQKKKVITNL